MSKHPDCSYHCQIHFHEVDRAGIMFFAHLFTHAHNAYEQFMNLLGHNLNRNWEDQPYRWPIVNADADYKAPLHHGTMVTVLITIPKVGQTSFTTSYDFLNPTDIHYAQVRLVHCCIDATSGKACAIPNALRTALETYQAR